MCHTVSHSCSGKDFQKSSTQSSAYPVHLNMAKLEDANGATAFLFEFVRSTNIQHTYKSTGVSFADSNFQLWL